MKLPVDKMPHTLKAKMKSLEVFNLSFLSNELTRKYMP